MKEISELNELIRNPDLAPPLTGGALLNLDGQCCHGPAGRLGVALTEPSVRGVLHRARPTHWLLPLEAAWIAQHLPTLEGEVIWASTRAPQAVLGALNEDVQGAWIEGAHAVLRFSGTEHRLHIQHLPAEAFRLSYIARLAVNAWVGPAHESFAAPVQSVASIAYQFAA